VTGTRRKDLSIPEGWKPTHHATVQVLESSTLRPVDMPVAGLWRCIDRAPDAGWWLQPKDGAARAWLAGHGRRAGASSGMVNVHGLRLVPSWLQLSLPGT
jgi:hypothetical protein